MSFIRVSQPRVSPLAQPRKYQIADFRRVLHTAKEAQVAGRAIAMTNAVGSCRLADSAAGGAHFEIGNAEQPLKRSLPKCDLLNVREGHTTSPTASA